MNNLNFMNIMKNEWIIGIVCGIISGIIVYFITSYVVDKRNKNEHKINVMYANDMVLDILRPYIVNSGLPSKKELTAIINSISRKCRINPSEMNSITVFYEDLILDFIANLYIPDEIKKKNIEKLLENIDNLKKEKADEHILVNNPEKDKVHIKSMIVSMLLGISVTTLSAALSSYINDGKNSIGIIICMIISIVAGFISIWIYIIDRRLQKRESIKKNYQNILNNYTNRMTNHGPDLNGVFDKKISFKDYYK